MAITKLASQVPTPQVYSGFLRVYDGENTTGNAPVSRKFQPANNLGVSSSKLNANFTMQALLARYGGGGYGIAYGLDLSAGSELTLNIAAGHSVIDGLVENPAATTLALTDNGVNYIYHKQNGTFTKVFNSTTPGDETDNYIGNVTTSGGAITAIDTSGVCYFKNGAIERQTADTGEPADTPNASWRGWTVTSGGRYWWTGTGYERLGPGDSVKILIPAGRNDVIPAGSQKAIIADALTVRGSLAVRGHLVVRA